LTKNDADFAEKLESSPVPCPKIKESSPLMRSR